MNLVKFIFLIILFLCFSITSFSVYHCLFSINDEQIIISADEYCREKCINFLNRKNVNINDNDLKLIGLEYEKNSSIIYFKYQINQPKDSLSIEVSYSASYRNADFVDIILSENLKSKINSDN